MKTTKVCVALLAMISVSALACDKGCAPYKITANQTVCACDAVPEIVQPVQPSDELPPKDKMPSYQREGVHADMPKSLAEDDMKMDEEKVEAEVAGKKRAGIE